MLKGTLYGAMIEMCCPSCKHGTNQEVRNVLEKRVLGCTHCGAVFKPNDDSVSFAKVIQTVTNDHYSKPSLKKGLLIMGNGSFGDCKEDVEHGWEIYNISKLQTGTVDHLDDVGFSLMDRDGYESYLIHYGTQQFSFTDDKVYFVETLHNQSLLAFWGHGNVKEFTLLGDLYGEFSHMKEVVDLTSNSGRMDINPIKEIRHTFNSSSFISDYVK